MPTPAYIKIEGATQGLITQGAATEDSIGNIWQEGCEDEILVQAIDHVITIPRDPQPGQPSGQRVPKLFKFTAPFNKATPLLYNAFTSGKISSPKDLIDAIKYFDEGNPNGAIEQIANFEQKNVAQPIYDNNPEAFAFMHDVAKDAAYVKMDLESIPLSTCCNAGGRIPFNNNPANPKDLSNYMDRIEYFKILNNQWNGSLD